MERFSELLMLFGRLARDPEARLASAEARYEFWLRRADLLRAQAKRAKRDRRKRRLYVRAERADQRAAAIAKVIGKLKEQCSR